MTITLDLTDNTKLTASLRQLDAGERERLLHAVQELVSADNDTAIMNTIRETLVEEYPWVDETGKLRPFVGGKPVDPDSPLLIGVVFTTMDWDNGNFLTDKGRVLLSDGQVHEIDFVGLDGLFTEEFGARGANYSLSVDLRTGVLDGDDYAEDDIHARFGIAPPAEAPSADTDEAQLDAAGLVAMLGERGRDALREALHDADRGAAETALLHQLRATLAHERPSRTVAGVLFTADDNPSQHHLCSDGLVVYTDGSTETVAFAAAAPILVDRYGTGDAGRSLAIDLRTEQIATGDDTLDVHAHFGLPSPAQS